MFRAGVRSLRDIASEYGTSEANIRKRAKAEGWPRDLSKKIQERADDLVRKNRMRTGALGATEHEIIEASASTQAEIRTEHSVKATSNRRILEGMIQELSAQNEYKESLSKLGELMLSDAAVDKLNEFYHKIISFGGRVDSAKKLMEAWAKIVETERKVYGIVTAEENYSQAAIDEIKARIADYDRKRGIVN